MNCFADTEKNSEIYTAIPDGIPAIFRYDGNVVGTIDMSEIGVEYTAPPTGRVQNFGLDEYK